MSRSNALSALGRMPYAAHLMFYPAVGLFFNYVVMPKYRASGEASTQEEWDTMCKRQEVDPDNFNPFTPIPFHNNPELKYIYANVNMRGFINRNTGFNADAYVWRNYHNSYDHSNKKQYAYSYTSV